MDLKYLPLGAVCSFNGSSKKMMVIGYQNNGFEYSVLPFPEGIINEADIRFFNHNDIVTVYSTGYSNEEYEEYNVELLATISPPKYQFDENGIVVSDENDYEELPKMNIQFDESGIVIADGTEVAEDIPEPAKLSGLQFDESGVVIGDDEGMVEKVTANIQFDESGMVISDGTEAAEAVSEPSNLSGLQFDESGVVIADDGDYYEDISGLSLRFDENGVVISDGEDDFVPIIELPEEVVDIKYDENGLVILEEPVLIAKEEDADFEITVEPLIEQTLEKYNESFEENSDSEEKIESELKIEEDSADIGKEIEDVEKDITNDSDESRTKKKDLDESEEDDEEPKKKKGFFGGLFG